MKKAFWIAALSLTTLLGTNNVAAAKGNNDKYIVDANTVAVQLDMPKDQPEQWIRCGVRRDQAGHLQRDAVLDTGISAGRAPWKGGMTYKRIGIYPIVIASDDPKSNEVVAGIIDKNNKFTARRCTKTPDGTDIAACSSETTGLLDNIQETLRATNEGTNLACAKTVPMADKELSPAKRALVRTGEPTHPATFTNFIYLIHEGHKYQ